MKYLYISILSLFLLSCSTDLENQTEKPIDWEEELFGVGLYGTHPDSLNQVWHYYKSNSNSAGYINSKAKPSPSFYIKSDTLIVQNNFFYYLLEQDVLREDYFDSSTFLLALTENNLFKLTKIEGHPAIPKMLFVQLSSKSINEQFQHLNIRTYFVSSPVTQVKLASYRDTSLLIFNSYQSDKTIGFGKVNVSAQDKKFINSFINTLIPLRHNGERTNIVCSLGAGYDMELIYDSLSFKYEELSITPVEPRILHDYFIYALDTSQFTATSNDLDDYKYLKKEYQKKGFRFYEKGNDLVDTATVQMIEELPETDTTLPETPPIIYNRTDTTYDTIISININ
jgi:hypothetical protein